MDTLYFILACLSYGALGTFVYTKQLKASKIKDQVRDWVPYVLGFIWPLTVLIYIIRSVIVEDWV